MTELEQTLAKLHQLKGAGLITDNEYSCIMARASKSTESPSIPISDTAICSAHSKMRSMSNLQQIGLDDDGTPKYQCTLGSRCKGAPSDLKPGDWTCNCGANNFARRIQCFFCGSPKAPRGAVPCATVPSPTTPANRTQRLPPSPMPLTLPPYGYPYGSMRIQCARHGKMRSMGSVVCKGKYWVCRDGIECKVGSTEKPEIQLMAQLLCTAHQRLRTGPHLDRGVDGLYYCKVGMECKVGTLSSLASSRNTDNEGS
eukprot:NODE_2438_length_1580_cov_80.592313_g2096_i0.p1 GENE.NODE_2438_length_1580_cov_80.592313_g2096_i0~~NODE_2438_length_1580_cov_80.592313_g2096_i0.p1  ORF type:complete len:277 (-),score=36.15 NODE_2438_length_1580_cov_80.592313_g2096_i0:750-1517(-)